MKNRYGTVKNENLSYFYDAKYYNANVLVRSLKVEVVASPGFRKVRVDVL